MRKFFNTFILFLITLFTFTSCEKEPTYHKVRFELTFLEEPSNGNSNMIDVNCVPHYSDEDPTIVASNIQPGYVWSYEYWEVVDGDKITFIVNPQLSYRFEMRVYVDGELISYRKIVTSDNNYYETIVEDEWGLNNEADVEYSIISFYYYE